MTVWLVIQKIKGNQMDNLEDNQQEHVNSESGIDFEYEMYIQVSKKASDRVVYQDQKIALKKYMFFVEVINIIAIHFHCRNPNVTLTSVKFLSNHKGLCQKVDHCEMNFCKKKNLFPKNFFQNIPSFLYCIVKLNVYVIRILKTEVQRMKKCINRNKSN